MVFCVLPDFCGDGMSGLIKEERGVFMAVLGSDGVMGMYGVKRMVLTLFSHQLAVPSAREIFLTLYAKSW